LSVDPDDEKPLDLESLGRVVSRLREAVEAHRTTPENLFVLDSVIKRFELTYELSIRSLRRFLRDYEVSGAEIEDMSFQGIVRRGHKDGFLQTGWPDWKDFRDARNKTVHTYREEKAREVAAAAEIFVVEAEFLLDQLKRRTTHHA
jgi:nucleotidyltransferase substrate binding protein (TIGR01987 family)